MFISLVEVILGSTAIDLMLGNHPDIFSVGEISMGLRRLDHELKSGTEKVTSFWPKIAEDFDRVFPNYRLEGYVKMLRYLDNWYRIPQILLNLGIPSWVESDYVPMTRYLFESIAENSGSTIICDSSKEFGRAFFLLSRFPKEVKAIYLVRNGHAVLHSYLKRWRQRGTFHFRGKYYRMRSLSVIMITITLALSFSEFLAQILRALYGNRVLRVRYEDLCSEPGRQLKRIGKLLGVDLSEMAGRVEHEDTLQIGPILGDNAIKNDESGKFVFRMKNTISFDKLPRRYKWLYRMGGFLHAIANGYW